MWVVTKTNKKVLLREHKRHTNCGVSSTPSVTWGGVLPPAGVPPGQVWQGVGVLPEVGYPPDGVPPKVGYPQQEVPPWLDLTGVPP